MFAKFVIGSILKSFVVVVFLSFILSMFSLFIVAYVGLLVSSEKSWNQLFVSLS
jgi:hypothetical protein